jgi:V/A-type H+-transporting ATPase subunit D
VDAGLDALREMVSLNEEIRVIDMGIAVLNKELRVTSQRVNLFEKIKIPGAQEAIRLIRISLGDQMTNAIGRSKIAKKKIEEAELEEARV